MYSKLFCWNWSDLYSIEVVYNLGEIIEKYSWIVKILYDHSKLENIWTLICAILVWFLISVIALYTHTFDWMLSNKNIFNKYEKLIITLYFRNFAKSTFIIHTQHMYTYNAISSHMLNKTSKTRPNQKNTKRIIIFSWNLFENSITENIIFGKP